MFLMKTYSTVQRKKNEWFLNRRIFMNQNFIKLCGSIYDILKSYYAKHKYIFYSSMKGYKWFPTQIKQARNIVCLCQQDFHVRKVFQFWFHVTYCKRKKKITHRLRRIWTKNFSSYFSLTCKWFIIYVVRNCDIVVAFHFASMEWKFCNPLLCIILALN